MRAAPHVTVSPAHGRRTNSLHARTVIRDRLLYVQLVYIDVDVDKLYVKQAVANDGPRMKRIRPAPMGRAYRYVRRSAHIELVLAEKGANSGAVASVAGEEAGVAKTAKAKRRVPAKRIKRKKTARAR